ncbi:MAG TPA: ribose-phosphate pyrophosphokinase [Oscillospiraceae bacterium]|nr:ribose-phosphate pyrophosphokinase [Oscillospiraceae bacterium]
MPALGPIGLIGLKGARDFSNLVNDYLVERRAEYLEAAPEEEESIGFLRDDYHIPVNTFRFSSGEGKAVIENTIRGHDLYLLCDVTNYTVTYNLRGIDNHMSPDDHYQDLKRVILAASGKARRINVIMPYLYEGRQHRRNARESLDCANMLIELTNLGVSNFITFDAHDDRVANAAPTSGFENVPITYQVLKALFKKLPDFTIAPEHTMVVSPDEGAIYRTMYYASILGLPLGTFYKRRDYTMMKNGRNPIIAHEFLGDSVEGKDLLVIDDMISSGESMIELSRKLKERGANKIFCIATFGLFTDGLEEFDKAYRDGVINNVLCTNLIYRSPELLAAPWYIDVNMAKFVALLIDAMNHNASISTLIDPTLKINALLDKRRKAGC